MEIGFYFPNEMFCERDCSNLENGNPGIGGTFWAMLQLIYVLSIKQNDKNNYYLLLEKEMRIPKEITQIIIKNKNDISDELISNNIDVLLVNKTGPKTLPVSFFDKIRNTNVKVIVWAHCFISNKDLNQLAHEEKVKKIVAVSKSQYYTWIDHKIFEKSTYIYNICDFKNPFVVNDYNKRKNNVVFLGAINQVKGVHLVTKAWKEVKKEMPNAHLFIIGSGKLYNTNGIMGKYGIAEEWYEHLCLKPIINHKNKIDPSVHFLGVLGEEKWKIMNESKVGIVNAASWETFGYTMIEMQMAGMMIVSKKSPGLLDTMYPQSGILYDNIKQLSKCILKLLRKDDYDSKKAICYINDNFSTSTIIEKWYRLFDNIDNKTIESECMILPDFKYIKYANVNRIFKHYFPVLPSLNYYRDIFLYYQKIFSTISNFRKIKKYIFYFFCKFKKIILT